MPISTPRQPLLRHQLEQLVVLRDVDAGLSDPVDFERDQLAAKLAGLRGWLTMLSSTMKNRRLPVPPSRRPRRGRADGSGWRRETR